jgi:hypothetical protein
VFDAGDEEEVEFVIVDDEPFHLRRVHTAERLRNINYRDAQIRKDVPRHPIECEKPDQRRRNDHHQQRYWTPQGERH